MSDKNTQSKMKSRDNVDISVQHPQTDNSLCFHIKEELIIMAVVRLVNEYVSLAHWPKYRSYESILCLFVYIASNFLVSSSFCFILSWWC